MKSVMLTINLKEAGEIEDEDGGEITSLHDLPQRIEEILAKRDVAPTEWSSLVIIVTNDPAAPAGKMNTHSKDGREWARISQLKDGDLVELDGDFTCEIAGKTLPVSIKPGAIDGEVAVYVKCNHGSHDLGPNARETADRDGDHIVGVWPAAS